MEDESGAVVMVVSDDPMAARKLDVAALPLCVSCAKVRPSYYYVYCVDRQ